MADQKITELPIKGTSAINLADYLLGIDSADGYQMLISDLAKKIIEAYNGSSLGGSARTLKSALDTIATNSGSNLATIETSTTASKAYAVGDYLVMNGILYKVTTAIASGGTITVDTNVTVAAAGDDIAAIAAKIGNTSMGTTATTITGAIAEHEADISGLNSNLDFIYKSYQYAYTVNGGSSIAITGVQLGFSAPEGYTPIGFRVVNTGTQFVIPFTMNCAAQTVTAIGLKNISDSDRSNTLNVVVMYAKNSIVHLST